MNKILVLKIWTTISEPDKVHRWSTQHRSITDWDQQACCYCTFHDCTVMQIVNKLPQKPCHCLERHPS